MRRRRRLARSIRHPPPAVASLHAAPSAAPNFPPPPLNRVPSFANDPPGRLQAVELGMAAPPERRPHRVLASLIANLEATKPKAGLVDPATDFAVCRQFALSVYARADRNDVNASGTSNAPPTRTQVEAFSAAGTFLAALDQSSFAECATTTSRATGVRGVARVGPGDGDARGTPTVARQRTRRRFISERNRGGDRRVHAAAAGRAALAPRARAASCVRRVPIRVPRRLSAPARGCAAFDPRAASLRRAVAAAAAAPARSPLALHGTPVAADVGP